MFSDKNRRSGRSVGLCCTCYRNEAVRAEYLALKPNEKTEREKLVDLIMAIGDRLCIVASHLSLLAEKKEARKR